MCDHAGVIQNILCDDFFAAGTWLRGQVFEECVDPGSRDKVSHLLAEVNAQGSAFDWELTIAPQGKLVTLHFSGFTIDTSLLIVGDHIRNDILQLQDELMRKNNELVNTLRAAIKDQIARERAEEALRETAERFQCLFEDHHAVMLLIEPDTGQILDANQSAERFYGYSRTTLKTMLITEINVLSPDEVKKEMQRAEQGTLNYFVFPHRLANGDIRQVEVYSSRLLLNAKPILFSIVHDITERKQAEDALEKTNLELKLAFTERDILVEDLRGNQIELEFHNSVLIRTQAELKSARDRYADLFELAPVGYCIVNEKGLILEINLTAVALLGVSRSLLVNKPFTRFVFEEYKEKKFYLAQEQLIATHTPQGIDLQMVKKDGSLFWAHLQITFEEFNDAPPTIRVVISDITERKRVENELSQTNAYLENLINYANAPIIVWDPHFHITRFNHAFESLTGCSEAQMLGQTLDILFPSELVADSMAKIRQTLLGKRWETVEIAILHGDGSIRTVLWNSATVFSSDGRTPIATIAQGQDITERKRAEQELGQTNAYLENLINYANAPIIVWDPQFRITRFNHAFEFLTGRSEVDVLGQSLEILFPAVQIKNSMAQIRKTSIGERWETVEIEILHRDGSVRTVLWNSATLFESDGKTTLATIAQGQDITERKRAERHIVESERRFYSTINNMAEGVLLIGFDWTYLYINKVAEFQSHLPAEDLLGRTVMECWPGIEATDFFKLEQKVMQDRNPAQIEGSYSLADGAERWFSWHIQPADEGLLVITIDITERRQVEEALLESETRFRTIFEQAAVGVAVLDTQTGRYERINQVYCDFLGYTPEEMTQMGFQNVTYPDDTQANLDHNAQLIAGQIQSFTIEKRYVRRDGAVVWGKLTASPLWKPGNTPHTYFHIAVVEDITKRKRMEQELLLSELDLKEAQSIAHIGSWKWDVNRGEVTWSDEMFRIFGIDKNSYTGRLGDAARNAMHPDDLYIVMPDNAANIANVPFEYRIIRPDGAIRLVWAKAANTIFDQDGKPTLLFGVAQDITERKQAEEALLTSEARFRSLFEQTHDAVFLLDLDGQYLTANQRAADMFGISMEELRSDVLSGATILRQYLARMLAGEEIPAYEIIFQKRDGQPLPVEMTLELVRDANGKPKHIQALVRDISARKQAEEKLKIANEQLQLRVTEIENLQDELRAQAVRDPLTGLYNRRYLNETLTREMGRTERENDALSIIIADIDHFKMINDTYGHQVGDQFLIEIANVMGKYTRDSDIACRYGGEEFLLVLPGISNDFAVKRAEEIRLKCADLIIQHDGKELLVTMSFGVATYPDHGQTANEIIIKADKAMYHSKQTGRNKVTTWEHERSSG